MARIKHQIPAFSDEAMADKITFIHRGIHRRYDVKILRQIMEKGTYLHLLAFPNLWQEPEEALALLEKLKAENEKATKAKLTTSITNQNAAKATDKKDTSNGKSNAKIKEG